MIKQIKHSKFIILILTINLIISCSSDDDNPQDQIDPAQLNIDRQENLNQIIQNSTTKVWRIDRAILNTAGSTIDISDNFNIKDDEFVFKGNLDNISLEWRQGFVVNQSAQNSEGTFVDYYLSPENFTLEFLEESSTMLQGSNFEFEIVTDNTVVIKGTLLNPNRAEEGDITVELIEKMPGDYTNPPTNGLNFTEAFTFEYPELFGHAVGMIGSYSDNSIFIAGRDDSASPPFPEKIIKYNFNTNSQTESLFNQSDLVSKQMHIVNNELYVIGGQFINKYNLDLSGNPTSIAHGKFLTRFGMAVQDDNLFLIGGDIFTDPNTGIEGPEADQVFKWDLNTSALSNEFTMPARRYGARGTIINNKLYVFGGREAFTSEEFSNTIFIHDLETGNVVVETMTQNVNNSFVDKYQNLIFVAGQTLNENDEWEFLLGVYDTFTGTFQEIAHNLPTGGDLTVFGMTVLQDKMYVIYGPVVNPTNVHKVMVSNL